MTEEYDYVTVAVQRPKRRTWKCERERMVKVMTDKPNCSTCDHKDNDWCEVLNRILPWCEKSTISEVGCMLHSHAREYLMREVK